VQLAQQTGATQFHSSARIWKNSSMQYINDSMNENLQSVTVDEEEVRKMATLIRTL
jgi:copper homeostasis protein CutC